MKISRILHAGYVFESGKTQIIFDPIFENPFSKNCYAYPAVEFDHLQIKKLKPDAIFISHYHDDHCSLESLNYLDRDTVIYLYCIHEELFELIKELGFKKVLPLITEKAVKVGGFEVIPCLALDADVDSIFHIKAEGLNILNVVDAWIDPSAMEKLTSQCWDMVLWPFQTMREIEVIAPSLALPTELPVEWLEQLKELNPRVVVPSSCQFIQEEWSWYRKAYFPISYRRFQQEVEAVLPEVKVWRMNPGVSVDLTKDGDKASEPLPWVFPRGNQDVDYEFDPNMKPQTTAEIAKHFGQLTADQTQRVLNFCKKDLIEKYTLLGTGLSGQWKLDLYNHFGGVTSIDYDLQDGKIKLTDNISLTDWITEVPLAKVYAALEEGEQLSSMYLRMQGMPFDDIAEDPLIVSLFIGDFGAYQRNQVKKIVNAL